MCNSKLFKDIAVHDENDWIVNHQSDEQTFNVSLFSLFQYFILLVPSIFDSSVSNNRFILGNFTGTKP